MGQEAQLGAPLGGSLAGALGLRPASAPSAGPSALPVEVLLVGAGGSGGAGTTSLFASGAGGGGAGQVLSVTLWLTTGAYPVAVGLGGRAGYGVTPRVAGDTTFAGLRALGGGAGYPWYWGGWATGASLGGGANDGGSSPFNARALTGFNASPGGAGDSGSGQFNFGGGGGGSSGAGLSGGENVRALGGPGVTSSISGTAVEYGRGGNGALNNDVAPVRTNPGDGGPGAGGNFSSTTGRDGILILRYLTGTQTWTGGTITTVGPWTIHTCTADTTLTRTA